MSTVNYGLEAKQARLADIHADMKWNSRQHYEPTPRPDGGLSPEEKPEESIQGLAEDIAIRGLISPLIVRERKLVRGGREGGGFELVVGFRRFAALQLVAAMPPRKDKPYAGFASAPVVIIEADEKEALLYNLRENLQRKDLTTYDLAVRVKRLSDDFALSGAEIGRAIGRDRNYCNLLISRLENLPPQVLEAWAEPGNPRHGLCNTANLNKLVSFRAKDGKPDREAQLAHWAVLGGETEAEGEESATPRQPSNRPSVTKLTAAIARLKAGVSGLSVAQIEATIAALAWAAGTARSPRLRVGGVMVYDPKAKAGDIAAGDDESDDED